MSSFVGTSGGGASVASGVGSGASVASGVGGGKGQDLVEKSLGCGLGFFILIWAQGLGHWGFDVNWALGS